MEGGNGINTGMLPSSIASGMLDLEMPLHRQQQQQQLFPFAREVSYPPQQQELQLSTEEPHAAADAGNKRGSQPLASPWQRMKWTDSMVRLLIMVVYCVGDDVTGGTAEGEPAAKGKKAPATASAAGLLLQKKGKWKSVSRAMMEKGFCVSPQQCEDKFNDLNKRYKRVNDLLGKGTACRVVENQALLDTMDHLSPKAKEEARKLLNSKHLFFREMCAYHNSGNGGQCQPPLPSQQAVQDRHESQQQCAHHPLDSSQRKRGHIGSSRLPEQDSDDEDDIDGDGEEDADNDEDADDDYDDDEDDADEGNVLDHNTKHHQHRQQQQPPKQRDDKEFKSAKRARTSLLSSSMSASPPLSLSLSASPAPTASTSMQQLKCEFLETLATMGGEQQQRQWLRRKAAELEEQRLGYQYQALELERQRFKWLRFSGNKEREMERMKLHNERLWLENDHMLLLLHQKEHEFTANASCANPVKIAADHLNISQLN